MNIHSIDVTFEVSKLLTSTLVKFLQSLNIHRISVTFDVLKLLRLREVKEEQYANINIIFVTFKVLKLLILRDFREVITHNPEPYNSIYNFIRFDVIPKYPCLTSVHQANFDEEGNPRIQYYIRYAADLSINQEDR